MAEMFHKYCNQYFSIPAFIIENAVFLSVFFPGDLFDEGKWCSDLEFEHYIERFHKMFRHPDGTKLEVVVGNHDIGFHYM